MNPKMIMAEALRGRRRKCGRIELHILVNALRE
jgi:hypothetical protein